MKDNLRNNICGRFFNRFYTRMMTNVCCKEERVDKTVLNMFLCSVFLVMIDPTRFFAFVAMLPYDYADFFFKLLFLYDLLHKYFCLVIFI